MSTGYGGYSVVSPAVLERRALAAADARFERACEAADRLADEIAAARRSFGDLGVAVAPVARPAATSAAVEAAAEQVEAATREARRAFKTALAAGRSRAMTRSIATTSWLPAGKDTSADERRRRLAAARAATEAARREAVAAADRQAAERRDEIERVVARLPADVDGEVAARAESAAAAALAATGPNAYRAAADDLRATVQLARDVDRDRRSRLAEVDGLRRQLDGLDSPAVTALRRRLDAVDGRDPLPDGLPGQVAQAVAAARAESDRRFVFDAVAATFDELGYEVDEGFATAVAAGGAVLTLPWSGDHGVRVRARDGNLLFNVVRYDDGDDTGDEATDTHAESAFCDGYERLQAVARRHGVEIDVDDPQPPGHRPLQRVAAPRPADAIRVEAEADDAAGARERRHG